MADDLPEWAKTDAAGGGDRAAGGGAAASAPAAAAAATAGAGAGAGAKKGKLGRTIDKIDKMETGPLLRWMRFINVLNGLGMILMAIGTLMSGLIELDISTFMLSAYISIFGLLLVLIELNFSNLEPIFRRLFGFMFTFTGRALYLLFWPGWLVGGITCANALFNMYVIARHPSFKSGELSASNNPYGHYTGGEKEMLDHIKRNPDLARKAVKAGAGFARENPAAARSVASAAVSAQAGGGANDNPFGGP